MGSLLLVRLSRVSEGIDQRGMQRLSKSAERTRGQVGDAISVMETLVINVLGPKANTNFMRFQLSGKKWEQIPEVEREDWLSRLQG